MPNDEIAPPFRVIGVGNDHLVTLWPQESGDAVVIEREQGESHDDFIRRLFAVCGEKTAW